MKCDYVLYTSPGVWHIWVWREQSDGDSLIVETDENSHSREMKRWKKQQTKRRRTEQQLQQTENKDGTGHSFSYCWEVNVETCRFPCFRCTETQSQYCGQLTKQFLNLSVLYCRVLLLNVNVKPFAWGVTDTNKRCVIWNVFHQVTFVFF